MRSTRMLLATLGAALLAGLSGCGVASASTNGSSVWVEVSPGTINAGSSVRITANCGDSSNSATVTSIAFGTITLMPEGSSRSSIMTATVMVPPSAAAGTFAVDLTCKTGSTASTTLTILGSNAVAPTPPPTMGPHTGGGFLANGGSSGSGSRSSQLWIGSGLAAIGAAVGVATLTKRRRRAPVRVRRR